MCFICINHEGRVGVLALGVRGRDEFRFHTSTARPEHRDWFGPWSVGRLLLHYVFFTLSDDRIPGEKDESLSKASRQVVEVGPKGGDHQ